MNKTILVNKDHPINENQITGRHLMIVKDTEGLDVLIDQATWQAFKMLQKKLSEKQIEIGIDSAYRSLTRQKELYQEFIQKYGEEYAKKVVAPVGTSEHHTGFAIDLAVKEPDGENWMMDNEVLLSKEQLWQTIHESLADYGFILRYPKEKEFVTKYPYEPWHIRYVGRKLAQFVTSRHFTLEEYYEEKSK